MLGESNAYGDVRARDAEEEVGHARTSASSTTARSPTTSRSSRRSSRRSISTRPKRSSTTSSCKRFLAVFYPAAEHLVTTRITRVEGEPFKTEGKVLVNAGLARGVRQGSAGRGGRTLAPVEAEREGGHREGRRRRSSTTRPPPRYNEGTLLSAMEGAGKLIEDDELREAMREKGLGTPATRASIIEGLICERYIHREGKELMPTAKAFSLMTLLHGLGVPGALLARAHRRVGVQARADGARQAQARASSCDEIVEDDRAHRRARRRTTRATRSPATSRR